MTFEIVESEEVYYKLQFFRFSGILVFVNTISTILPFVQIGLGVLLIASILLQQSGAGVGGAFGGFDVASGFHTKRGFEKFLFIFSIILAILFALTALLSLVLKN